MDRQYILEQYSKVYTKKKMRLLAMYNSFADVIIDGIYLFVKLFKEKN